MIRAARVIPAALAAVGLLLTGQASHASAVSDSSARTSARADAFYCGGGPTFQVVNRVTFGGAGWIQETGLRNDGARAVNVYHPTGRNDEYRWRLSNGQTHVLRVREQQLRHPGQRRRHSPRGPQRRPVVGRSVASAPHGTAPGLVTHGGVN